MTKKNSHVFNKALKGIFALVETHMVTLLFLHLATAVQRINENVHFPDYSLCARDYTHHSLLNLPPPTWVAQHKKLSLRMTRL